ncbi:MAG: DNA repair protein RadA [Candidatus Omnitrophica bacterium]|nr:DNA repair protein RadA [Candidatus Omnitrophota bacterium]
MFTCNQCGYRSVKWLGRCPICESWDSFDEMMKDKETESVEDFLDKSPPLLIRELKDEDISRVSTGIGEFDRVLGGGLVKGEVVLVGGEPGIGKSTLLLQIAGNLSKSNKVLYVSAEESIHQVNIRAKRLNIDCNSLYILNQDNLLEIYNHIKDGEFNIVVIDSIHVVYNPKLDVPRGTLNQIRNNAEFLTRLAKAKGITFFIIAHVTKEGVIAGPKILEHIVDCVLYFESESISQYRVLRASKNRFGSTGEIAIFEMLSFGLREAKVLSEILLPHKDNPIAGSCISCVVEGQKPMLVELQALVSRTNFGIPRRRALGLDFNRFSLLVATVEKRLRISLANYDVFLNVAGGIKITDPSADLATVTSIISSFQEKEVDANSVFIGEVGLGGELRPVSSIGLRLKELEKGGFKKCFIPKGNLKETKGNQYSFSLVGLDSIKDILDEEFLAFRR